jgi:anti-sigma B factor antagonist
MPIAEKPFQLSVDASTETGTVVRLSGELDLSEAPELQACLSVLFDAGTNVVVDLSELSFLDSSGIGVLIAAHKRAALLERSFVVRGPSGGVARVLQISGVDQVLTIEAADG